MATVTHILTVTIKELRELFHRPMLVLTLILGPLIILIVFGIGSDANPQPPRAIVVLPPGQAQPRLLQNYQRQFEEALSITAYTSDEAAARSQLRNNMVDAVVILPPSPFETIARGERATIRVLYNEIDPLWRGLVPRFVGALAGEINRELFLQNAGEQRGVLTDAGADLAAVVTVVDQAMAAVEREDWDAAQEEVSGALTLVERASELIVLLGPQAEPLRGQIERTRLRLQQAAAALEIVQSAVATPTGDTLGSELGLVQTRRNLQGLRDAISAYTSLPPEVVIAPLAVETQLVARLEPDFITFFAPAILALLLQHIAVSLGALALVRERLAGTFDLYVVAPISNVRLLLGKYVAYVCFTLAITMILLLVLLYGLGVPLFGNPLRLAVTLFLLAVASVGLGFTMSLLASSERQAVQFSMLALLGIVFFSGFALPLDALRQPALTISYAMPATYGVILLQDIMLRGLPGSDRFLLILGLISALLFFLAWGMLQWRTRAQ